MLYILRYRKVKCWKSASILCSDKYNEENWLQHLKKSKEQRSFQKVTTGNITEPENMACTWLGEICSCSRLIVLPGPAWVLLK